MTDFASDAAFFGAITNQGSADGFFTGGGGAYGRSAALEAALDQGGPDARSQGPQASGGGGGGFGDFMEGGGGGLIGSGLDFIGKMIGLGVQDQYMRDNPGAPVPQYGPAPAAPAAATTDNTAMMMMLQQQQEQQRLLAQQNQQQQGMSPGLMVMGGLLGLGLFGTLMALLVRRTGAGNRGWANEDLGFSETFVDFI